MSLGFLTRIVDYNYPFQANVAISATSEDPEFPSSNFRSYIRSKKYRSTGFFVIDSTNLKLDFQEVLAGPQLTATIAAGSYTPTTLAAAIVTAMQAAGTKLYSASFSATTGLWTIATTNGTYLKLLSNTGTNVATGIWSTIGFDTAADYSGALTYDGAKIALHSYEAITFDLGSAQQIDTFVLLFDPVSGLKLSPNAVVRIQGNATNNFAAPAVDVVVTASTQFNIFSQYWSSGQNYRYWRVKVTDPANPNLYVELGKIILAKATVLTRQAANGFKAAMIDRSKKMKNDYGHEYVDSYPLQTTLDVKLNAMPYADAKTINSIFQRVGTAIPIWVAADPTGVVFDRDHFAVYGKLENADLTQRSGSFMDHPLRVAETS